MIEYLRTQLAIEIRGGDAHIPLAAALAQMPWDHAGDQVPGLEHTVWSLAWHIEVCMADIISYVCDEDYSELPYPSGYWPTRLAPKDEREWNELLSLLEKDLDELDTWVKDGDLLAPLAANPAHTLYRQLRIIGQHNSYHTAQIVDLRALIGLPVKDW